MDLGEVFKTLITIHYDVEKS